MKLSKRYLLSLVTGLSLLGTPALTYARGAAVKEFFATAKRKLFGQEITKDTIAVLDILREKIADKSDEFPKELQQVHIELELCVKCQDPALGARLIQHIKEQTAFELLRELLDDELQMSWKDLVNCALRAFEGNPAYKEFCEVLKNSQDSSYLMIGMRLQKFFEKLEGSKVRLFPQDIELKIKEVNKTGGKTVLLNRIKKLRELQKSA